MLSVKNLTKIYPSKKGAAVKALKDVSADFGDSGLVFLLGKSGSGKSTLLNLLGGIDKATSGEIIVQGKSSQDFAPSDYDSYRNTHVGFIFQEYNLIENYTVGANIALALELQGKQADKVQIEKILRKLELVDDKGDTFYHRMTRELSGGQRQRVAIARALIKNPRIILADEPTGALDSETGRQFYDILKRLAEDKLIIVVTHDRENAEAYGSRIIELKDGVIVGDSNEKQIGLSTIKQAAENQPSIKFISSKLPFKRSFTLGASALKTKKIRLSMSILLSFVTFVIFGFSLTAALADKYSAELKTLYDNHMYMIGIEGKSVYDSGGVYESRDSILTEAQLTEIKKYNNGADPMRFANTRAYTKHPLSTYNAGIADYFGQAEPSKVFNAWNTNPYIRVGVGDGWRTVEIDPVTGEADVNLRPDGRFVDKTLCRLPKTFDEIAITDLKADMFMKFGFRSADGTVIEIKTPDDLIGKQIGELTICGVYSTEQDLAFFKQYDIDGYQITNDSYLNFLVMGSWNSVISYNFVCKGFTDYRDSESAELGSAASSHTTVLVKLSGDMSKDKALFKKLSYKTNSHVYSAQIVSPFSYFVSAATGYNELLAVPAIILVAVFSVFSALLMMNFLAVSLDFKKKELGILRALGARKKDILMICLAESMLIAAINFVLSLIAVIIISIVCNIYFYVSLFIVGFAQIALLFLLVFGVSALATIIPVSRIAHKKPIDIINNRLLA